jgi:hypothetical protein
LPVNQHFNDDQFQQSDSQQCSDDYKIWLRRTWPTALLHLPVIAAGQLLNRQSVICSTIVAEESQGAGFAGPGAKLH